MGKILFLINPHAGRRGGAYIQKHIIKTADKMIGYSQYAIEYTQAEIAKQIKNFPVQYDTIVVAGGDGTISHVVQASLELENKPKVGIIPLGIGNDLAQSLGIQKVYSSKGLRGLLEVIVNGKTRAVDIVSLGDTVSFTNYCGFGIDAKISNDFNRLRTKAFYKNIYSKLFNKAFYTLLGINNIFHKLPHDIVLKYHDHDSGDTILRLPAGIREVLISNVITYAGGERLSSQSRMDDGKFEVTVITSMWQWWFKHLTRFLKRPLDRLCPALVQFQTDKLEIAFEGAPYCQVDGEIVTGFIQEAKQVQVYMTSRIDMIVP